MKRYLILALLVVAGVVSSEQASAQSPSNFGFFPFGFYQPYGARYGNTLRTPPYFATNPPVYYGARHARSYGLSPFASPPLLTPSSNYRSRLRNGFAQPPRSTPGPTYRTNPCISHSKAVKESVKIAVVEKGPVRSNPFADVDRLVQN